MSKELLNFIQNNSPDGGFLQSPYWREFQESYGRKTFQLEKRDENSETIILASVIVHRLPAVGNYFYVPRGPIIKISNFQYPISNKISNLKSQISIFFDKLINLGKQNKVGWIRIEPNSEKDLKIIRDCAEGGENKLKIAKSPVDVQPREILVMNISRNEEEILAGMKQKTRYNIRLSQRKGVRIMHSVERVKQKDIDEFLRLVKITAKRDKIRPHPDGYYRKMLEAIPSDVLRLYIAEYQGKIISASIVSFFGEMATYLHGASDNVHREVMAPYLLQWQAIRDAKKLGCTRYDLGGVETGKVPNSQFPIPNSWAGITRFKTGFAPAVGSIQFPGCYDIILKPERYNLYRFIQKIKKRIL